MEVLEKHKSDFGQDFSDNKKALDKVTVIRSKGLKNEIAGYITKYIKREIHDKQLKEQQEIDAKASAALDDDNGDGESTESLHQEQHESLDQDSVGHSGTETSFNNDSVSTSPIVQQKDDGDGNDVKSSTNIQNNERDSSNTVTNDDDDDAVSKDST